MTLKLFILSALVFLTVPVALRAQFVTQNAYVEANVSNDGLGLLRCYYANTNHSEFISHPGYRSYVTFAVNGNYYTNNPYPDSLAPLYILLKGGSTVTIADTIETLWHLEGADTFDVVQDVYPVAFHFAGSGQIVYKFSVRNRENRTLSAQVQYLLDIDLGVPGDANDNAPITTRYGYISDWLSYPNSETMPPYYIATLNFLRDNNFPTLVAMGYNNDSFAPEPMGLLQPQTFSYVDWPTVRQEWSWGSPTTPGLKDSDGALLIQWPSKGVNAGGTAELGRGSYGSASCTPISIGNLNFFTVHPDHIVWDTAIQDYVPNHFPVEGIVWNPNSGFAGGSGTQIISNTVSEFSDGPIHIVSPSITTNDGYSQQHTISINGYSAASISWEDTVTPGALTNCSSDSSYDLNFMIMASGVPGEYTGECHCPIVIDCQERDVVPPRHSPHRVVGNLNDCNNPKIIRDSVFDNNGTDQGVERIAWVVSPTAKAIQVDTGVHPSCTASSVPITVTQVDTLLASCVYFTFTDCLGNESYDTVCYAPCAPGSYNSMVPNFWLQRAYNYHGGNDSSCDFESSAWDVTDSLPNDGIKSLAVVDSQNMNEITLGYTEGSQVVQFAVFVVDSSKPGHIIMKASDIPGNVSYDTITYCAAPTRDEVSPVETVSMAVIPNPVEGEATFVLSGTPWANVEIFDVLGREVAGFRVEGSYEWETIGIPRGTYIIRANENGPGNFRPIVKRIVKE